MLSLIITLALCGFLIWAVTALIPMPDNIKRIIYIVGIICAVFFVLSAFGILGRVNMPVPQIR